MKKPGELCGPLGLPASYTEDQLIVYGWDKEADKFTKPPKGGWGPQAPRTRKPSFYWKTR